MILWLSSMISAVLAASVSLPSVSALDVVATVNPEGKVNVAEELIVESSLPLTWQVPPQAKNIAVEGDSQLVEFRSKKVGEVIVLTTEQGASSWTVTFETNSVIRNNNRDQLFLPIVHRPNRQVYQITVQVKLPPSSKKANLSGHVYSLGSNTASSLIDEQTIQYSVDGLPTDGTATVNASWDSGVIELTSMARMRLYLSNLEIVPWLVLGLLLPIISAVILLLVYLASIRNLASTSERRTTLPQQLSPLIIGTVVRKKIYPEVIVSTFFDLCLRGYLVIVRKNGRYYLSLRHQIDNHLSRWESSLLQALFGEENKRIDSNYADYRAKEMLYNQEVKRTFLEIYDYVTAEAIFTENPHHKRASIKLFGLLLYFGALLAAVWVAASDSNPALLLPIAGLMLISGLIIKLTNNLVSYTQKGRDIVLEWQKFRNYLALNEPLQNPSTDLFERFLPYAVTLGVAKEWATRFELSSVAIRRPDWLISYEQEDVRGVVRDVLSFADDLSKAISTMRGPSL